jgi:hypothetical protein
MSNMTHQAHVLLLPMSVLLLLTMLAFQPHQLHVDTRLDDRLYKYGHGLVKMNGGSSSALQQQLA